MRECLYNPEVADFRSLIWSVFSLAVKVSQYIAKECHSAVTAEWEQVWAITTVEMILLIFLSGGQPRTEEVRQILLSQVHLNSRSCVYLRSPWFQQWCLLRLLLLLDSSLSVSGKEPGCRDQSWFVQVHIVRLYLGRIWVHTMECFFQNKVYKTLR